MARLTVSAASLRLTSRYVFERRGTLYYRRRVPADLRDQLGGKEHRMVSLRTRDPLEAIRRAYRLALADEVVWTRERKKAAGESPRASEGHSCADAKRLQAAEVLAVVAEGQRDAREAEKPVGRLSQAFDLYLREHPKGGNPKFRRDALNILEQIASILGDVALSSVDRSKARAIRDSWLASGLATTSVRRHLNTVAAVWGVATRETDQTALGNPFAALPIPREGQDSKKRMPFTVAELKQIAEACRAANDDVRWIIAMMINTGARLGEVVGLRPNDVVLNGPHSLIAIRPDLAAGRTLKTPNSERFVPLVGVSQWAAAQAIAATQHKPWLFPRYASDRGIRATHAANTINKWLSRLTGTNKTSHSFRHAMRDRLRNADVPTEIQDAIGGWGTKSVGQKYGSGYGLESLARALNLIVLE